MKQRYNELTHELCVKAVLSGLDKKWCRKDVLLLINKFSGIGKNEFRKSEAECDHNLRLEAADGIAFEIEQRILELMNGNKEALDLDKVIVKKRKDGMTGKIRNIAELCMIHQLIGHLIYLGLEPTLYARIIPHQYASIPGRGQVSLKEKIERYLRKKSLGIKHSYKVDVESAYGSLQYSVVIDILRKEIPSAKWIITTMEALAEYAPGGHLIIGGYLDAWLFNFVISYSLRYAQSLHKEKRGKVVFLLSGIGSYMDDIAFLGRREADLKSVVRAFSKFIGEENNLKLKDHIDIVRFMSVTEEHERKKAKTPGGRGCTGLDIGGYVIHRTYTTIRPRIFLRVRRNFMKANRTLEETGTIPIFIARKIISYNGYFDHTHSQKAGEKYNREKIKFVSAHVVAYHDRMDKENKRRAK